MGRRLQPRWVPSGAWRVFAARGLLWLLAVTAGVGGMAGLMTSGASSPSAAGPAVSVRAASPAVGGVAERAVSAWIADSLTSRRGSVEDVSTVAVADRGDGRWEVTVAAEVSEVDGCGLARGRRQRTR